MLIQGLFLVISILYRRSEQVTFFGLGYISACIAAPVGSLIAYGSGQLYASHTSDIPGWKWYVHVIESSQVECLVSQKQVHDHSRQLHSIAWKLCIHISS